MADHIDFAYVRKVFYLRASIPGSECIGASRQDIEIGKLIADLARRTALKQQRLILCGVLADLIDHAANASAT